MMIALLALLYFERYRGLASGIKLMGEPLGSLLFPQVALLLDDGYGYKGSLLIFGAISMHVTAAFILLREPSWTCKTNADALSKPSGGDCTELDLGPRMSITEAEIATTGEKNGLVMGMLRCPMFYTLVVSYVMIDYALLTYTPNLVDFGTDRGFSKSQAQSVVSISSIGHICGLVLPPLLSDRKYLSRRSLYLITFFMLGIAMFIHSLVESYTAFALSSTVVRCFIGCLTTMKAVVVGDYFGAELLTTFWSIAGVASLPLLLLNPSITGMCRS